MISVRNHRRPSNGNKPSIYSLLFFIIILLSLQSCAFIEDLFSGKDKKEPKERPDEKKKVEIRELEWEDVTDAEEVIRNYPDRTDDKEEIFDVLCLLPFSGANQEKGRSLYTGIKMAAKGAAASINIRITTFDIARIARNADGLREILTSPEFDLVISPYSTDDVNNMIELSRGSGAVVLSPWNTSSSIKKFSRYVQLNPGLESHFSGMVDWTTREFGVNRTLVVSHKKDARLVELIQDQAAGLEDFFTSSNPKEDIQDLGQLIVSKNVEAIIIPSWRSSDEAYFLSLLSAINAARRGQAVSVFVLSSWMDNSNINYDQFNGMNLHFTSSRFVNSESRAVQRFDEQYIDQFHFFPENDVYYGHDVYLMVMDWLSQYKSDLADQLINYECRDCFFRYDFVNKISDEGQSYILNDHVDIISFKDFQYHRLN